MLLLALSSSCATPSATIAASHSAGGANPSWEPGPDTGDGASIPPSPTMATLLDENGVVEVTDVALGGSLVYATAATSAGDALVIAIDPLASTVTTLHAGFPLVQPAGLALSLDSSTLFVADPASEIHALPSTGGAPVPVGAAAIELPTDVALDTDGSTLLVPGFRADGVPCVFAVADAQVSERACGAPLREPLAVAVSPIDGTVAVVDAMAGPGEAPAILALAAGAAEATVLAPLRGVAFPGGIAALADGRFAYSAIGDPGLLVIAADGAGAELDTMGLLELPAGVAAGASLVVAEASRAGDADVYEYRE